MPAPLTKKQAAVVLHESGHALVGAVAGSGKTHTMVARVIHLLKQGIDPKRILVLMFNKSAQEEFLRRLRFACKEENLPAPEVLTFHGFGLRLISGLERSGHLSPRTFETTAFKIRQLAKAVLMKVNAQLPADEQLELSFDVVSDFLSAIDYLKGDLYPSEHGRSDTAFGTDSRFITGFYLFEAAREAEGIRLFADLIYDPVMAALENQALEAFIGNRYQHILIDEFQDINEGQMTLVRMLAGKRATVMAVGDEDQCIYAWRGARPDYMTSLFTQEFPNAVRYSLPHSFRYGHSLSLMANFLITKNQNRTDKLCISGSDRVTAIDVRLPTDNNGQEVAAVLREWTKEGRLLKDAVVLLREYAHSPSTEIALLNSGIPYWIVGAAPFFERAEVLGLRAYIQLAAGGFSQVASPERRIELVSALLQTPTLYLRRSVIDAIAEEVAQSPNALLQIAEEAFQRDRTSQPFTKTRRLEAVDRWRWVMSVGETKKAAFILNEVVSQTNLFKEIEKNVPDSREAAEKIGMIKQIIQLATDQNCSSREFALFLDQLAIDYSTSSACEDRVLLTSIHRAKGLEWALVILPELTDGNFPAVRSESTTSDIEDERRLFYVGITRVIEKLVLLAPTDGQFVRAAHRGIGTSPDSPKASRFLYEGNILVASEGLVSKRVIQPDARCGELIKRYERLRTDQ